MRSSMDNCTICHFVSVIKLFLTFFSYFTFNFNNIIGNLHLLPENTENTPEMHFNAVDRNRKRLELCNKNAFNAICLLSIETATSTQANEVNTIHCTCYFITFVIVQRVEIQNNHRTYQLHKISQVICQLNDSSDNIEVCSASKSRISDDSI